MIQGGHIYVAPPDHHMLLRAGHIRLDRGPKVHHTRPAADPLFLSAAEICGPHVIGIVLSGGGSDGADGLRAIKERGGLALVQCPGSAEVPFMPRAAIAAARPDAILQIPDLARLVRRLCSSGSAPSYGSHRMGSLTADVECLVRLATATIPVSEAPGLPEPC
jgi:two-component system chemotaxis response regulator CheB